MTQKSIVVIGAGVAGLTTALLLSRVPGYKIIVAAKHMPGDYDIEYASPWAGANYMPVSLGGTNAAEWDKVTWKVLHQLALEKPEAGIHFQDCEIRNRTKDIGSATADWFSELLSSAPWFKDVVPNCLGNGVTFKRATFNHISETSAGIHPSGTVDLVVNCTGLMASRLGGVEDKLVVPARGQIVIVRNESDRMVNVSGTDHGDEEACYVMTRAAGGGTVLGGSYQKGNWESQPDPSLAVRIMKRAVEACPELTGGKGIEALDVVRHGVGLRPVRHGGTRVERERLGDLWVVHNYGAGGAGYQSSYGCAEDAVNLIRHALEPQAKL
ncbi:uncharacterized protein PFLUO_LOCUS7366 [Penicillium psychrofluorescens]|uniref:uncharacterized protein n=1 Tax=Penicillium psychrofluorescens TaxID=3158075 RepID=UPI003CCCFF53